MKSDTQIVRIFLMAVMLTILITGCSQTSVALKFADTFLSYQLNDAFDLSSQQKLGSREFSQKVILEIKDQVLKPYAIRIKQQTEKIDQLKAEDVRNFVIQEKIEIEKLANQSLLIVSRHLPQLTSQMTESNWKSYKKEFLEKNKDILDETEKKSRLKENLERFLGSLTAEQTEILQNWEQQFPNDRNLRVKNRQHVLMEFESKMGSFNPDAFQKTAIVWTADPRSWQMAEYKDYWTRRTDAMIEVIAKIGQTLTEKQKARLKEKLTELAEDILKS